MRRLQRPAPLVLLAAILIPASIALAELSKADWEKAMRDADAAFKEGPPFSGLPPVMARIGEDDSARAVEFLSKATRACNYDGPVASAAIDAFAAMKDAKARAAILKEVHGASDWRGKVVAIEAIREWTGDDATKALVKAIKDPKNEVQAGAVLAIGERDDPAAFEAIADLMVSLDDKKGMVWEHCKGVLARRTGEVLDSGAGYKVALATGKRAGRGPATQSGGGDEGTSFFGLKITCARIVFVIDISGSMVTTDPSPQSSSTGAGEADDKERQRIKRAKKELVRVVKALPEATEFNIIAYSNDATPWNPKGMVKATAASKGSAVKFVDALEAHGATFTDDALDAALASNPGVECIYLLSDGSPTHEGGFMSCDCDGGGCPLRDTLVQEHSAACTSRSCGCDHCMGVSPDTRMVIERIYEAVREGTRFRHVAIYTLGFRGANPEFMRKLAGITGGVYREIE